MKNTNSDEQKKLVAEIHKHSRKGIDLFKEAEAIHETSRHAPDKQNPAEETAAIAEKDRQGIAEVRQATELQKVLMNRQRADLTKTLDDLKTKPDED